eukprot:81231_1
MSSFGDIPQNTKYLIFGYHRRLISHFPQLIPYLVSNYFIATNDKWDQNNTDKSIVINGNSIKRATTFGYKSSCLSNICLNGIHIWKFKVILAGVFDSIGIYKTSTDTKFDTKHDIRDSKHSYAVNYINTQNKRYVHNEIFCRPNDIIELKLSYKELTLSYSKKSNENDRTSYIKAFDIEPAHYRVAVSLSNKNAQIELLSYRHIVLK